MAGLVIFFVYLGAGGRLPKARRGRFFGVMQHHMKGHHLLVLGNTSKSAGYLALRGSRERRTRARAERDFLLFHGPGGAMGNGFGGGAWGLIFRGKRDFLQKGHVAQKPGFCVF